MGVDADAGVVALAEQHQHQQPVQALAVAEGGAAEGELAAQLGEVLLDGGGVGDDVAAAVRGRDLVGGAVALGAKPGRELADRGTACLGETLERIPAGGALEGMLGGLVERVVSSDPGEPESPEQPLTQMVVADEDLG